MGTDVALARPPTRGARWAFGLGLAAASSVWAMLGNYSDVRDGIVTLGTDIVSAWARVPTVLQWAPIWVGTGVAAVLTIQGCRRWSTQRNLRIEWPVGRCILVRSAGEHPAVASGSGAVTVDLEIFNIGPRKLRFASGHIDGLAVEGSGISVESTVALCERSTDGTAGCQRVALLAVFSVVAARVRSVDSRVTIGSIHLEFSEELAGTPYTGHLAAPF